jgi:hypothetical protein
LSGENLDYLVDVLPDYFSEFEGKNFSKFSKVKVETKDGRVIE